jgi:hypothetical protein
MKKKLVLVLVLALAVFAFAACGGGETTPPVDEPETPDVSSVKTGYAVISKMNKSADAGEADGLAQADSTIVAVTVDENGVLTNVAIDHAQTKINFSADGKIVTPLDSVFPGKQELGPAYGMAKASSLGKEWNEQANALAQYVVGKTVEEVKGIAVTEEGVPTDADLSASVTIKINDYVKGIEMAVANAQDLGASADDLLGIGIVTTIDKSKDAGDEDGVAQAYTNYAVVTFDADGVITSSIIDASQININFSKEGKITSDMTAELLTKNALGADYGMAKASGIGKEWNEQAAAFAEYVIGKTAAEVEGIALTEDGVAADADLAASVTVHIGPFMGNVAKAYEFAK